MRQLFKRLQGLYYYFQASSRVIIPISKGGWTLLWNIANSWQDGYPGALQFGMCVAIETERAKEPDVMLNALDLINYHYERQCYYLGSYGYLPKGDKRIIEWGPDYLRNYSNLGWKATFEWSPVC